MLSVVLRYGAAQKQRLGYSRAAHRPGRPSVDSMGSVFETDEDMQDIDRVAAMVEGVKTRGVSGHRVPTHHADFDIAIYREESF